MNEKWVVDSIVDLQEHGAGSHASTHGNSGTDRVTLDASQITSGIFEIGRIPEVALERLVTVDTDTARFSLTTAQVQNGDSVYVTGTQRLYIIKDQTSLSNENGYFEYRAYVSWDAIAGKPSTFIPSAHNQDANTITTGTLDLARIPTMDTSRIPNLDAGKITSGTFDTSRLPVATTSALGVVKVGSGLSVSSGTLSVNSSSLPTRVVTFTLSSGGSSIVDNMSSATKGCYTVGGSSNGMSISMMFPRIPGVSYRIVGTVYVTPDTVVSSYNPNWPHMTLTSSSSTGSLITNTSGTQSISESFDYGCLSISCGQYARISSSVSMSVT